MTVKKEVKVGSKEELKFRKRAVSSLDRMLEGMKKKKLTTTSKSKLDWQQFKTESGITEEVEQGVKNGYLEKQAFLQQVDMRQFEQERAVRERERVRREANKK